MQVSGMTDLQIILEALRYEGFTLELIGERLDELRQLYVIEMERAIGNGQQAFPPLPGVKELFEALMDHPRYHSALLYRQH
jgi:hypothetical protein